MKKDVKYLLIQGDKEDFESELKQKIAEGYMIFGNLNTNTVVFEGNVLAFYSLLLFRIPNKE